MNVTQFLDARESWEAQIPGYSYKLAPSQYALDSFASDKFYVDEAKMAVYIPFASGERRDGVGDLLEIGGIETDRHRVNPIVLFDHGKQIALPIAVAEDPETKNYTVELDTMSKIGGALCYFYGAKSLNQDQGAKTPAYEHLLFCEQIFDMMAKRFIRGGSIGYTVIHANELPPDFRTGTPAGLHLLRVKMLEVSAVILPANQDTVSKGLDKWASARKDMARRILSIPEICGKAPSPYLVKSLLPIAGQKKVTLYTGQPQKNYVGGIGGNKFPVYEDPKTGRPQSLNTESNRAMGANVAEPWHGRPQGLASRNDDNSDQELREWGERIRQQKANYSQQTDQQPYQRGGKLRNVAIYENWHHPEGMSYEDPEDTPEHRAELEQEAREWDEEFGQNPTNQKADYRSTYGVRAYEPDRSIEDMPADAMYTAFEERSVDRITPEDEAAINAMASDVELEDKALRRPQIGERVTYAGPGARPSEPMGEVLHTDSTGRTTVHWEDGTLPQQYDLEHLKSPAGESYSAEEKAVHPETGIDPEDPNSYRTPPIGGTVRFRHGDYTGPNMTAEETYRDPQTGRAYTHHRGQLGASGQITGTTPTQHLVDPEGEPYKSIQPTRKALKPPRLPSRNVETKSTDDTPKPVKLDTSHSVDPGIDPEEANRLNAVRGRPKPGTRVRANYAGQGEPREGTVTHLDDSHYTYPVEVSHQGDEGEIVRYYEPDEVTDMEGRPYKSIEGEDTKSVAPELRKPHYKNPLSNSNVPPARFKPGAGAIKSMDPNAMNPQNMPVDSPTEEMNDNPEPYGAQVLRRLHEDGSRLLADYDSLLYHLEHEPTRQHLMQTCAAIEDGLSVVEKMWRKEKRYKELPPLIKSEEELDQEIPEEELMGEVPEDKLPPEQMQEGLPEEQLGDEEWDQPMAEEELASPEDEYYGEEMPGMGMDPGMDPGMEDMNGDGMPDINSEDIQGDMDTIDDNAVPANSGAELPPPTPEEAWEASQRPQDDAWSQQEREFVARGSGKAIKRQKSLRVKYKAIGMLLKGMCPACGAAGCKCYMKGLLPAEQKSDYAVRKTVVRPTASGKPRRGSVKVRAVDPREEVNPGHQEELDRERQEWQQEFGRNPTNMPQRKSDPTQPGPRINEMGEIERAGNIPQVKPPTDQQKKPEQKVGQQGQKNKQVWQEDNRDVIDLDADYPNHLQGELADYENQLDGRYTDNTDHGKAMNADQIQQQLDMFDWDDQDRSTLMEISSFVDELGQEGSIFDEETRMKAYHYHKTMEKLMAAKASHYDRPKDAPTQPTIGDQPNPYKAFEMEDEGYKNMRRNNGS